MKASLHSIVINRWTAAALLAGTLCLTGCHHENGDDNRNSAIDQRGTSATAMNISTGPAMTATVATNAAIDAA
jgi:hypothetical protein